MTSEIDWAQLERSLLDPARVESLLAEDFVEVGASGARYDKASTVAAVRGRPARPLAIDELRARALGSQACLVTYRADGSSLRCTLWEKRGEAWRAVYHQGTRAPG